MFGRIVAGAIRGARFTSTKCKRFATAAYSPKYLMFTNITTTSTLLLTADLMQQSVNKKKHPEIDWEQARRMMSIGVVYGPLSHFWYKFLESRAFVGGPYAVLGKKILWDTIATPLFSGVVIIGMGILEGKGVKAAALEYWRKLYFILALDCSLWPPIQYFNFRFAPARYRVLVCNCGTLVYNIGLSFIKHSQSMGIE